MLWLVVPTSALAVLDGTAPRSWFDSGWYFISMVYFRLLAVAFWLLGATPAGGRALNAVSGTLLVCAVAWIGWRAFSRPVGLAAAASGRLTGAVAETAVGYFRQAVVCQPAPGLPGLNLAEALLLAGQKLQAAEEARRTARDKQEIAAVESEVSMLAAQLAAIRKLRKK